MLWGFLLTLLIVDTDEVRSKEGSATDVMVKGLLISTWAGVVEEMIFRWIIFYTMIFFVQFASLMMCGIIEWIYLYIEAPIYWCLSFGYLEWLLYDQDYWFIGAGAVAANIKFRNGHTYQGWFGMLNSYVGGFVLFWIMFNYGLPAAIAVHFLYELVIYMTLAMKVLR